MRGSREVAVDCRAPVTNLCCCRYFADGLCLGSCTSNTICWELVHHSFIPGLGEVEHQVAISTDEIITLVSETAEAKRLENQLSI